MKPFKPMLAAPAPEDLTKLRFPILVSPKLDGIRCVKLNGKALSRKLLPIPNNFVRNWIEKNLPDGIDGELMLMGPEQTYTGKHIAITGKHLLNNFNEVQSAIMSVEGEPDFVFCAFDCTTASSVNLNQTRDCSSLPFRDRFAFLSQTRWCLGDDWLRLRIVPHEETYSVDRLLEMAAEFCAAGFEGAMIRDPNGPYKFGRSTEKEGYLLKLKSFVDEEAVVIGCVEEMENTNEATVNELGQTKRSSAKAGMVPKGVLGALQCRFDDGTEFEVGSGFTDAERVEYWERGYEDRDIGRIVTVKHQPPPGGRKLGEAPRFPVFKGFRHD